jgi:hypothetical protein
MADVTVSLATSGKDQVVGDLKSVESAGHKMGETFGSIAGKLAGLAAGYVTISTAVGAFNKVMDKGGELADFSEQTGIAVGKLVLLGRAFENNGMHAEDLGKVINKMQKFLEAAGEQGSASATKLAKLGLTVADLKGMSPDMQFEAIAKAIASIQDPGQKAAMAMEIFGKSGGKLLTFFNEFDGSLSQAKEEVGSYAEAMQKNAKSFDGIGDGIAAIGSKLVEFTAGLLDQSVPAIEQLVKSLKSVNTTEFGKQFSSVLAEGINVALSVFNNPGNLFLAFGDSLVVVLKASANTLMDSMLYVFDWIKNYASKLIPAFAELFKDTWMIAGGHVISWFYGSLGKALSEIGAMIPGSIGKALGESGAKLTKYSQDASDIANKGLADAWDKIAGAASYATDQTKMQSNDWFDAAGSAENLKDHLKIASKSGKTFLGDMSGSKEHATDIAKVLEDVSIPAPDWWEEGPPTDLFADMMSPDWWQEGPPTDLFADMMSPDWWNNNNLSNQPAPAWWDDLGGDSGGGEFGGGGGGGGDPAASGDGGGGGGKSDISSTLKEILKCLKGDIAPALPVQVMS